MKRTKFYEIYEKERKGKKILFTKNLAKGKKVYDESLVYDNNIEYREWDARRSKLASFILKGADQIAIKPGSIVLYLGASTGTTVSHVSDIVGEEGFIFAIDSAARVLRDLVFVAENRKNIAPILGDANKPESYFPLITEVDMIYQDVAQKNQTEIFLKNVDLFLKDGGFALLAVKARSIDVVKRPKDIFEQVKKELEKKVKIIDSRILDPFQKDHIMFFCKK